MKGIFCGFCGQINYNQKYTPHIVLQRKGDPVEALNGENGAIQWISPYARETTYPLRETALGQLFLIGPVLEDSSLEEKISTIFSGDSGDYTKLTITDTSAGCFIVRKDRSLYLWAGISSISTVFFRVEGCQVMWSTSPLDLVREEKDFDLVAIHENIGRHANAFVYKDVETVSKGNLVRIWFDEGTLTLRQRVYCFDQLTPHASLSSQASLPLHRYVEVNQQALEESLRPLVGLGPIGLMLSGGVGSNTLAIIMKKMGIEVIAYHLDCPVKEGSERQFAKEVCQILDIPLRIILIEPDSNYFSPRAMGEVFVHPYAHPYGPKISPLAKAVEEDGVRWLVDGGGDDAAYGVRDGMEYSVYSIITATAIPWGEKLRILQALFSTRWSIGQLVRSTWPWPRKFLMGGERFGNNRADFLTDAIPGTDSRLSPLSLPELIAASILGDHGVQLYFPYLSRSVQGCSLALPDVFRLLPFGSLEKLYPNLTGYISKLGALVDKPVLRLVASEIAPPDLQKALWRNWHPYTDASIQEACVDNPQLLYDIVTTSYLVSTGIVDLGKLERGLASPEWLRAQYIPLIVSCLMEDFMRQEAVEKQLKRGGPEWK